MIHIAETGFLQGIQSIRAASGQTIRRVRASNIRYSIIITKECHKVLSESLRIRRAPWFMGLSWLCDDSHCRDGIPAGDSIYPCFLFLISRTRRASTAGIPGPFGNRIMKILSKQGYLQDHILHAYGVDGVVITTLVKVPQSKWNSKRQSNYENTLQSHAIESPAGIPSLQCESSHNQLR
jgi:hypothetical protein